MGRTYARRLTEEFYKNSAPWARDNIGWAVAMLILPPFATYFRDPSHPIDWGLIKTALWLYLVALLVYTVVCFFKAVRTLDSERAEALQTAQLENRFLKSEIALQEEAKRYSVSSDAWKDLAKKFAESSGYPVRADYQSTGGVVTWNLYDPKFRPLCMLAGSMLMKSPNVFHTLSGSVVAETDQIDRWLNYVKETKGSHDTKYLTEDLLDGTKVVHWLGSIPDVGQASANLCIECAAREV